MTNKVSAGSASASGQGGVVRKNQVFAAGGIVEGKGQIRRKNGEVVDFVLKSDPLSQEEADFLNENPNFLEELTNGSNTPHVD